MQEALDFPESSASFSGVDEQVIRSRNDTLRIGANGTVTYEPAAEGSDRYPLPGTGIYEAVEGCRDLAQRAVSAVGGEERLFLLSAQETGQNSWEIRFGYSLNGIQVRLGEDGWAARFTVEQGRITGFQLRTRRYTDAGTTTVVLPERQAMAAMEAKGHENEELLLVYLDTGAEMDRLLGGGQRAEWEEVSAMEWPRIKTIVLAILLITNIGLLSFVVQREYQGRQMQQEARENAIQFLRNSGIEVDPSVIPEQMGLLPQTVKRDREREARIASSLLGGAVQELSWGAEAFRYYNEKGYLQFHRDGAIKGEFVEGEFPIQDPESMDYSQEILRLLEFEGEVIASTGTAGEESVTTVVVRQSWKGAPLFRQELTLSYKNGCLMQVEGRRLNGEPALDTSREPISIPTALFQFYHGVTALGDVCSRIDSITEGYLNSLPNGAGPSALVPVWSVSTDTGAYLLDTLTGELSRADSGDPALPF